MRANLMYREGRADCDRTELLPAAGDLTADLALGRILEYLARGDKTVYSVCEDALLRPLVSIDAIEYRREILADAFRNSEAVRQLYAITAETGSVKGRYPATARLSDSFQNAVELLKVYTKLLRDLRDVADQFLSDFQSEGFKKLFDMLREELTDSYFAEVSENLKEIGNVDNILVSAKLGSHLQSVGYTLRRKEKGFLLRWMTAAAFTADAERDPAEIDDIFNRRERAVSEAANVLAWSAKYLEGFFTMLREELAFYIGCLNLTGRLRRFGMPVCLPKLLPAESMDRSWKGLYDVSLVLLTDAPAVGNDLESAGKHLYIITGANQGGKSTFLRSMGQAQLMAQCGMPVGADSLSIPIRHGVFSHFKKEEDCFMKRGRLEEELGRMSARVDCMRPGSLILMNESLSSTNEREGSEICRQITKAFVEKGVEVFSVTHLYMFAVSFLNDVGTQYLRAQRREDAERTYKILPGEPLETAFGDDLYKKIFAQASPRTSSDAESSPHTA